LLNIVLAQERKIEKAGYRLRLRNVSGRECENKIAVENVCGQRAAIRETNRAGKRRYDLKPARSGAKGRFWKSIFRDFQIKHQTESKQKLGILSKRRQRLVEVENAARVWLRNRRRRIGRIYRRTVMESIELGEL
jgi:hypothetical protein